jgi:type IV fimbrial biogenesis protein FimT
LRGIASQPPNSYSEPISSLQETFMTRNLHWAKSRGLTLVESLITLSIAAILLSTAIPSFKAAVERRHLEGAAAQLETDIQHARSLAVAQNRTMRIKFSKDATGSCYVVFHGTNSDCQCQANGSSSCLGPQAVARSVGFDGTGRLRLDSNVSAMVFDPLLGTSTPTGTLRFQAASGQALHLVVNIMGRVRACSPTGLPGYKPC